MKSGIYWFTNDLRIADNPLLQRALSEVEQLVAVYIVPTYWTQTARYQLKPMGHNRWQFTKQCIADLAQSLESFGVELQIFFASEIEVFDTLVDTLSPDTIYCAQQVGVYEQRNLARLEKRFTQVQFITQWQRTLLDEIELESIGGIARSFTGFRQKVERDLNLDAKLFSAVNLPQDYCKRSVDLSVVGALDITQLDRFFLQADTDKALYVEGGERAALAQLEQYFSSSAPFSYKQTRNDIDNFASSTKLSPWLALGCLSPRTVWAKKVEIENCYGGNQSTYWIGFELLWREFFHWLAVKIGVKLFNFNGISNKSPLTTFHAERFQKWCSGATPFPIVNACMHQMNKTGFLSNRGRQIVASCLVNELGLDWRYGAAYFEQQLIDYDVASNWGNWQYIAGVGVDPRGGRHFNLAKQTEIYDPDGIYIQRWGGDEVLIPLDSVDAADWPVVVSSQDASHR